MRTVRKVQVYGQRCSGTNALIRLIEANFGRDAFTENHGFKHWMVPATRFIPSDVLVLAIARDVGDWLHSLHRNPWHAHPSLRGLPFGDFIRAPWHSIWDDDFWGMSAEHPMYGSEMLHERDPDTGRRFANAVAMRRAKLANWAGLREQAVHVELLSHADLVACPAELVERLATRYGLARVNGFTPVTDYKGEGGAPFQPRDYPPLSDEDAAHVTAHSDAAVEAAFGLSLPGCIGSDGGARDNRARPPSRRDTESA